MNFDDMTANELQKQIDEILAKKDADFEAKMQALRRDAPEVTTPRELASALAVAMTCKSRNLIDMLQNVRKGTRADSLEIMNVDNAADALALAVCELLLHNPQWDDPNFLRDQWKLALKASTKKVQRPSTLFRPFLERAVESKRKQEAQR